MPFYYMGKEPIHGIDYGQNLDEADIFQVVSLLMSDTDIEKVIRAGCDDDEEFERIKKDPVEYDGHDCMVRSMVTDEIIARCDPEDMYGFGIAYKSINEADIPEDHVVYKGEVMDIDEYLARVEREAYDLYEE